MNNKKIVYNENTKLFEETTEIDETISDTFENIAAKSVRIGKTPLSIWLVIIIPSITAIIAIMGGIFAYQQANTAIEQLKLNTRQFDISKMPH